MRAKSFFSMACQAFVVYAFRCNAVPLCLEVVKILEEKREEAPA